MEPTTTSLGVQEARRRLPELLERAAAGESFVIRRHRTPLAALTPISGQPPSDPLVRERQIQMLMSLQGSGRRYWDANQRQPARPAPTPAAFVQPVQRRQHFNPHQLRRGSRVAIDGAALVAFLADAKGTGLYLEPLMRGIASGHWTGVISSVSLMRVLEGPLGRGDEALAQRYAQAFADPGHWLQIPADAAIVAAAARLRQQEPQLSESSAIELATAIQAGAAVLVSDQPALAQTAQHPVLSALRV
jgi:antitoxin (DNA-binding transcriptional repressor) of toxin-antitoxin stability system/predicted nucleic acid-binding protein